MAITISIEEYEVTREAYIVICTECGAEREMCEPDADNYPCEECGELAVYGAENPLIMGYVE